MHVDEILKYYAETQTVINAVGERNSLLEFTLLDGTLF